MTRSMTILESQTWVAGIAEDARVKHSVSSVYRGLVFHINLSTRG